MISSEQVYKKMCIFSIFCFSIFIVVMVYTAPLKRTGDGGEYMMQVEAWLNHGTMDIRPQDYITARDTFGADMAQELYDWNTYPYHHFTTEDGRDYASHFGGYALFVLPVKILLRAFGMNQFRSFMVTNAILYIIALLVVFFRAEILFKKRFYLLLFLMINPAIFYVPWMHTEVFSYAFVIVGLVLFYNRKYKLAIFFTSLGAMQNVALVFLGMVIGLDYWHKIIVESQERDSEGKILFSKTSKKLFRDYSVDIIKAGCCYFPCLLPIIHTMINFGKLNLVASVARENNYLFDKAVAYWLDLNLGILPYMPIVLILFFTTILIGLKERRWHTSLHIVALCGIYYVLANQRQINSAMAGIMRYNVWVTPVLIFFVVYNFDLLFKKKLNYSILMISVVTNMLVICAATGTFELEKAKRTLYGDQEFAPWTKVILKYMPGLYNPYHGIFITRTLHGEQYESNKPVVYCDDDGYIRKILVSSNSNPKEVEVSGSDEDIHFFSTQLSNIKNKEYQYITIPFNKKIKRELLSFNKFVPSDIDLKYGEYYMKGIYMPENDFCWIEPQAEIFIWKNPVKDSNLAMRFKVLPEIIQYAKDKNIKTDVYINRKLVHTIDLRNTNVGEFETLIIPREILPTDENGKYLVELNTNTYFSPIEEGVSLDTRKLSLQIQYFGEERKDY